MQTQIGTGVQVLTLCQSLPPSLVPQSVRGALNFGVLNILKNLHGKHKAETLSDRRRARKSWRAAEPWLNCVGATNAELLSESSAL